MNRLANATSPYLLQHASNPVDWWPWGEEAINEAPVTSRLNPASKETDLGSTRKNTRSASAADRTFTQAKLDLRREAMYCRSSTLWPSPRASSRASRSAYNC
ncbi:DUF255 domain-containing protein [Kitasatospora sp. GAS204B]|uniref:DUF255 domain-containing protein n=1 Tax=Kitasatospora sp. GAS204B TaxID=3035283 RepID=UPI00247622F4|nr:DUF255 domain-containing protein [Kitasatospora sp. GAS204B]